jgi:group I intron endonuclease
MKPTSDLCNRVLGSTTICGIYKITNKQTGDIYIGQSVNIADRWKQHIKCGLGIDASVTNKLYNNMQKYGVWNFTFEIL